jgi:two-component system phosphate regulon response regulator PhoB
MQAETQVTAFGSAAAAPTVLIVDDEKDLRHLLDFNLKQAGYRTLHAATGEEALQQAARHEPDMILLDLNLPDLSGIEVAKRLKADPETREIPIIMLTARGGEADKIAGLEAGADDYVTKPFSVRELLARIKAVLRRRAPQMTDDPVEASGLRLDPGTRRVFGGPRPLALGPSEFRLLHFLMTHAERVHSRTQLLDQVWGDHVFVEERTVDVHIRRLRKALEPSGHDRLIETVRGSGYRFSTNPA